ncbi:HTH-type transcriptional regulator CdhR [Photorhabdus australis subsp. thailandensis]|uniref:HTH-type transcriptional regulator CdhR n=1 Tax=Photorhabdus australis subsp. thailandensis TaxID=2805096 RepID=A0A1C0U8M2_9GAMM|nr:AraC family transcriptional regulator [Photorhabdus australis]OCQ54284.1 HTH-type transcriptional regulator CdhR [Photorhabdus australis subsp. thailandensis]
MIHNITILAVPDVQLLDVSGPLDVFAEANRILHRQVYSLSVMSTGPDIITSSSGVRLMADVILNHTASHSADTFLVAGAPNAYDHTLSEQERAAIIEICHRSQRYGSICTGALLLAQTGLLKQRRVTTHWACAELLAMRFPEITVEPDVLYMADGSLRTAAGVTSGLDLALRLVEEDLGRELAMEVAASLVMFFKRPVCQGHFIRRSQLSLSGRAAFQDLQRWAQANLQDISGLQDMATHMNLSIRHLGRLFRQELDMKAGVWLENARVEKARTLLEEGKLPLKAIPGACGYRSSDVMRRAFVKNTGMTPSVYRKIFIQTQQTGTNKES